MRSFAKRLAKQLLPPIISNAVKRVRSVPGPKRETGPEWHTVGGGPGKGLLLYVNERHPGFREMISGSYDEFFWRFLEDTRTNLHGTTVVDVGGFIGYHTLCFARLVGSAGSVHVLEPNPFNRDRMATILQANRSVSDRIFVHQDAIANENGTVAFSFSPVIDDQTSSGGYIEGSRRPLTDDVYESAGFETTSVSVRTLDRFVSENRIANLSLVKVDVEGAEQLVLEGATRTIGSLNPILLIEVHTVSAMLEVTKTLLRMNYGIEILQEESPSRCFIAARRA
jgi:FkbM family methyltransferase